MMLATVNLVYMLLLSTSIHMLAFYKSLETLNCTLYALLGIPLECDAFLCSQKTLHKHYFFLHDLCSIVENDSLHDNRNSVHMYEC